eukprot:CAMPEP_0196572870 /NCGR_PEP_ID=MMETSP1081-20130531/2844_1 /TAXON_ID=36882 /ORGANISM="Pyramimonas amylifera, Strain CCMP720" /LENGTH=73 /DNA_ID=CAMNT_0041890343 /DNA_START=209 /DNA_END=427 /DNA_ORIENTATION=+
MIKKTNPNTSYEVIAHVPDGIVLKGGPELKVKQFKGWMEMLDEGSDAALNLLAKSSGNERDKISNVPVSSMSW